VYNNAKIGNIYLQTITKIAYSIARRTRLLKSVVELRESYQTVSHGLRFPSYGWIVAILMSRKF